MTLFVLVAAITLAQAGLVAWALPSLFDPARPFGIRVTAGAPVVAVRRRYRAQVGIATVAIGAGTLGLATAHHDPVPALATTTELGLCLVFLAGAAAYLRARSSLAGDPPPEPARGLVDYEQPARPSPFPARWILPTLAITVATLLVGAARYRELPAALAVHWTAAGLPDRYTPKSFEAVSSLAVIQPLLTLFVLAAIGLAWTDAGCDNPRAHRTARLMLLGNGCANLALLCGSLALWGLLRPPTVPLAVAAYAGLTSHGGLLWTVRCPTATVPDSRHWSPRRQAGPPPAHGGRSRWAVRAPIA
jgi:uncharacterized membrane protein